MHLTPHASSFPPQSLIEHAYKSCLCTAPTDHPLLLAEASFNTPAAREKLAELMFEKFQAPALFLSKSAVLSAFAAGRGTALVLEMVRHTCTEL